MTYPSQFESIRQATEGLKDFLIKPPGWLASTLSALLAGAVGFFSAFFGQLLVPNYVSRHNMRLVLYRDLAQMFWTVRGIMNTDPTEMPGLYPLGADSLRWQQDQFYKFLSFEGEKYCIVNPAIYLQLSERFASQTIYRVAHEILEQPIGAIPINCGRVMAIFSNYVHNRDLKHKYFKKYIGRKNARSLVRTAEAYHQRKAAALHQFDSETKGG